MPFLCLLAAAPRHFKPREPKARPRRFCASALCAEVTVNEKLFLAASPAPTCGDVCGGALASGARAPLRATTPPRVHPCAKQARGLHSLPRTRVTRASAGRA